MDEHVGDGREKDLEICLRDADLESLERQNTRLVPEFKANKIEAEARKNWDIFYKRNTTKFFKDRHWTTREFEELIEDGGGGGGEGRKKVLLEVGCGVGNFIFPLIEEGLDLYIYCCDFSPRGVKFVQENPAYDESKLRAFECDITTETLLGELGENSVDIVSMVFVLSAIHPDKQKQVFDNLYKVLRPGGILLFRDYALYDMTMIRFGPGSKITDKLYMRQDGTRSYFFTCDELDSFGGQTGFQMISNERIERRTVNKKEGVDAARLFIQSKLRKPAAV